MEVGDENTWFTECLRINSSPLAGQIDWKREMLRKNTEEKPKKDLDFYRSYTNDLKEICHSLTKLKKELK